MEKDTAHELRVAQKVLLPQKNKRAKMQERTYDQEAGNLFNGIADTFSSLFKGG